MKPNPSPVPNNNEALWPKALDDFKRHHGNVQGHYASIVSRVCEDMQSRDTEGRKNYGVPLQASNGRNAIKDCYEEILDAIVYCKQEIEEERINILQNDIDSPYGFVVSKEKRLQKIYANLMDLALETRGMINE